MELIPQPDILIVPCTPIEVCEERIMQRGLWEHFRNKSSTELRHYLTSANQVVNGTVDYLRSKAWTIIEVDNSRDNLSYTQDELRQELMKTVPVIASKWKA
jgi:hypothetical protein